MTTPWFDLGQSGMRAPGEDDHAIGVETGAESQTSFNNFCDPDRVGVLSMSFRCQDRIYRSWPVASPPACGRIAPGGYSSIIGLSPNSHTEVPPPPGSTLLRRAPWVVQRTLGPVPNHTLWLPGINGTLSGSRPRSGTRHRSGWSSVSSRFRAGPHRIRIGVDPRSKTGEAFIRFGAGQFLNVLAPRVYGHNPLGAP